MVEIAFNKERRRVAAIVRDELAGDERERGLVRANQVMGGGKHAKI